MININNIQLGNLFIKTIRQNEATPNNRKINFYGKKDGKYVCSTNWYKTCKLALSNFKTFTTHDGRVYQQEEVKTSFS